MEQIQHGILTGSITNADTANGESVIEISEPEPEPDSGPEINLRGSEAQRIHRAKVATSLRFLQSMRRFLNHLEKNSKRVMNAVNKALDDTLGLAIVGEYPNFRIEYSEVVLSRGPVPLTHKIKEHPPGTIAVKKGIKFIWPPKIRIGRAREDDKVILIAYEPATNATKFTVGDACRGDGEAILRLGYSGLEMETWIAFITADENKVSNSYYTGRIVTV